MPAKTTRALTDEEVFNILSSVPQYVKNALLLEANTGLRISDIVDLKFEDIQFGKLEIFEKKTKKPQITKINMALVEYIFFNRTSLTEYIFWNKKVKKSSLIRSIERWIIKACDYHNINSEFISTHSFRKTFATKAYNETKDILIVQQLLNHSNISITERYIQINRERADDIRKKSRIGF